MTTPDFPHNYTTWTASCGCRITYKWLPEDPADPNFGKHRKHTPVSDEEHAAARMAHSGRDYPQHIRRAGCGDHWHENPHQHMRNLFATHYTPRPGYRLEWHEGGGFTDHFEG